MEHSIINKFKNIIIFNDMIEIYERNLERTQFKNKTILITGAYGMLASYLTYYFCYLNEAYDYNIKLICLVRNIEKAKERFGDLLKEEYFKILTNSLLEPLYFTQHLDFIIHAASLASPQHYSVRPIAVCEPNAIGTYHLLREAEQMKIKGFLLFSTGDIYGKLSGVQDVKEEQMGLVNPLEIHSCYNESKRMAETWCKAFCHEKNVPVKIARIWHTYSPTMDIEGDPRVFSSLVNCAVKGEDLKIFGDGNTKRTFCYITDAVVGYLKILTSGVQGEAYNVCNTEEFLSIKELAELIAELEPTKKLDIIIQKRTDEDTYLENKTYGIVRPINEKLMKLGWKAEVPARVGFSRVLESQQRF